MNFLSRLLSHTAIGIADGSARCLKGKLTGAVLSDIGLLAKENGVSKGEIWIGGDGRVQFSSGIPEKMHQRLRNVLSSH